MNKQKQTTDELKRSPAKIIRHAAKNKTDKLELAGWSDAWLYAMGHRDDREPPPDGDD